MEIQEIVNLIPKKTNYSFEAFIVQKISSLVEVRNQEVEKVKNGSVQYIALRLFDKNKMGFSFSTNNDIEQLIKNATENLKYSNNVNFYGFASHNNQKFTFIPSYDENIKALKNDEKISLAKEIENSSLTFDKKIKTCESSIYFDEEIEVFLLTSNGFSGNYKKNYCGGAITTISQNETDTEEGTCIKQYFKIKEFNSKEIGEIAAKRALEILGGKIISSEELPVVLSPFVASQFLSAAAQMFYGENAYKGKTLFADKINSKIANNIVTIIDDGQDPFLFASKPFDDEGIKTEKKVIVKNGILQTFLHNIESATLYKTHSTGNGIRYSFKSQPHIGTTNFYIENGNLSEEKLIQKIDKGLYLTKVMAVHSLNPISGDFSLGASGIMIENGKKTFPVRGITIAGNLSELFMNIVEIGNNLEFFSENNNCGSPTLLISKLSISGK